MNATRVANRYRFLSSSLSRRGITRVMVGSTMAGLFGRAALPTPAKNKNKGKKKVSLCHSGQAIRVGKNAKKSHLSHGDTRGACLPTPIPPPPLPVSVYQCPGPSSSFESVPDGIRLAQTFTPSQSGALVQIRFDILKEPPPTTPGDYVVQLLAVSGGSPGHTAGNLLAAVTISDATVPFGDSTLVANFPSGPALTTGTEFAAAIIRPGSNALVRSRGEGGILCAGDAFSSDGINPFELFSPPGDLVVTIVVV